MPDGLPPIAMSRHSSTSEREHRALEERYRRVVETSSDAIVITDLDRRIAFANPAAIALFGHGEALIGMPVSQMLPEEMRDAVRRHEDAAIDGEPQRYEGSIIRADGTRRIVAVTTAPLREVDRVTGIVASLRDVTEEQRLTEQLIQQEKLAAIGQLVSGVAHELNNPLAGVMAYAELLMASSAVAAEPETRQALETIRHEAMRASKIVSHLLTFARRQPSERVEVDLNSIVNDTLDLRRYAIRTAQIELEVILDPALPHTWADPFQLQQVLLNLVGNAEQALNEWSGTRRIVVRTRRVGEQVELSVADSGPGVRAEMRDRIFNPFFTTKPVGQGTGLGLSISDGIVRDHCGRIRVESQPGEGATFVVELPIVAAPAGTGAPPPA
jgi:two-component system NtrC family sensor kinase